MSTFDRNVAAFQQIVISSRYTDQQRGVTGKLNSDGTLNADPKTGLEAPYIWVRLNNDRAATRVRSVYTRTDTAGVPVLTAIDRWTQERVVLEWDYASNPNQNFSWFNRPDEQNGGLVSAMAFRPGLVLPDSNIGGLTVRILGFEHAGGYFAETTLLLVPTATASKKAYVLVGINPQTNAATQTLASDLALSAVPSPTNLDSTLLANPATVWLAAFLIANGATSIDITYSEAQPYKWVDLRHYRPTTMTGADGSNAGVSGAVPKPAATDNVKFLRGDGTWVSTNITLAGDSGTSTISPGDTLTVAGSSGIDTAVSGDTVTVSLDINELTEDTDPDPSADYLPIYDTSGADLNKILLKRVIKAKTTNTSAPPTAKELDDAFGLPASLGLGYVGILDDNGVGANTYLCIPDGWRWRVQALSLVTVDDSFQDSFGRSDGSLGLDWTGSTWTISSGKAINTPTLGSELWSNTGFETAGGGGADVFANWSENVSGTSTVNDEGTIVQAGSHALRFDVDGSNSSVFVSQGTASSGTWYQQSAYARSDSGTPQFSLGLAGISRAFALTTSFVQYIATMRSTGAIAALIARSNSAANRSLYIDEVSWKALTTSELLAYRTQISGDAYNQADVVCSIGTNAGLLFYSDASNFIIAYITQSAGTRQIVLEKCVAGTYTVVSTVSITYSAGATMKLTKSGTDYTVRYNGADVISAASITDATFSTATKWGLFSTHSANTFDNYVYRAS